MQAQRRGGMKIRGTLHHTPSRQEVVRSTEITKSISFVLLAKTKTAPCTPRLYTTREGQLQAELGERHRTGLRRDCKPPGKPKTKPPPGHPSEPRGDAPKEPGRQWHASKHVAAATQQVRTADGPNKAREARQAGRCAFPCMRNTPIPPAARHGTATHGVR